MKDFAREAVQGVAMLSSANCNFALDYRWIGALYNIRVATLEVRIGTQEKTHVPLEV